MIAQITPIMTNNYAVDFSSVGQKSFDYTPTELENIIREDLSNFDCITYLSTLIKVEEGLTVDENTQLQINLYLKTKDCEDKESMLGVITSYLSHTFLNH